MVKKKKKCKSYGIPVYERPDLLDEDDDDPREDLTISTMPLSCEEYVCCIFCVISTLTEIVLPKNLFFANYEVPRWPRKN